MLCMPFVVICCLIVVGCWPLRVGRRVLVVDVLLGLIVV